MENLDNIETVSICTQLNLNIEQLKIQQLLDKPVYRRLYNIVVNDKNRTQFDYRKNLIKQLYFLLKITPVMKSQLKDVYLDKIQKWYNLNDHKKTQLGSGGLKNLIQGYFHNKQKRASNKLRPQTGLQWNKNVHPFLRPYTATRQNNQNNNRPQSHKSKLGKSTVASTQLESNEEITLKDFNLSIEEQWQASQNFVNKNRTIHPQCQPVYEQLINLIKKAHQGLHNGFIQDTDHQILFQKDRKDFFISEFKDNKKLNFEKPKSFLQEQKKNIQQNNNLQVEQDKASQECSDQQQNDLQQTPEERKIYTKDQNESSTKKSVEQFQFYKANNKQDQLLLKKVNNKYLHLTNQKIINYSKNDQQLVRHYVSYTKTKSALKKELNRKSQSKRLLSAKIRSSTNLNMSYTGNQRIYSALPKKNRQKTQNIEIKTNNFFDFSLAAQDKQNRLSFISSPKYNQKTQLQQLYKRPIQKFKKLNKNNICVAQIKCKDQEQLLTKYDTFLTRQKINPIADIHVQKINQEALQEILKIKQKVAGLSKQSISTDSLMKALYINAYDDVKSCSNMGLKEPEQQINKQFDWKNKNIYYNMISDGTKKKLKKKPSRKLKKKVI